MIRARTTLFLLAVVGLLAITATAPGAAVAAGGDDVDASGPAELSSTPLDNSCPIQDGIGALCGGGGGGCSLCPDPYKLCC